MQYDFEYLEHFAHLQIKRTIQVIIAVCVLILSMLIYLKSCRNSEAFKKLPGLKLGFWQVLGHFGLAYSKGGLHPQHVYDLQMFCGIVRLHEKESFQLLWAFNHPIILVQRAEAAKVVMKSNTVLRKSWFYDFLHPWLGTGLLTSHGEKWKQRRKLLTPTFHFNVLKTFLPGINRQSKILVKEIERVIDEEIDIAPYITRCSLDIMCETILGVTVNAQTQSESKYVKAVLGLSEAVFSRVMKPWLWSDWLLPLTSTGREHLRHIKIAHEFTKMVITNRKKELIENGFQKSDEETQADVNSDVNVYRTYKRRAFLDFLLEEHINNNKFSEDDVREEVDTFAFEGHDTTAMGMSWALYLIGLYPEVQRKVQMELASIFGDDVERDTTMEDLSKMKYLECVLKEAQRLYPSVPLIGRRLEEDLDIDGYKIPKGVSITVFPFMIHRDPEVYPNPDIFDPDRFLPENSEGRDPFSYIPFSAGPRNCVGQKFAYVEEKTVLCTILRNYSIQSVEERDKIQVISDLILRPCYDIKAKFIPRKFS